MVLQNMTTGSIIKMQKSYGPPDRSYIFIDNEVENERTAPIDGHIPFVTYYERFLAAVKKRGWRYSRLSNGAIITQTGSGPRVAILAGLHGDEVSCPLSLLSWVESSEVIDPAGELWICPLVNDIGWDNYTRGMESLNLNRVFGDAIAPTFVKQICSSWSKNWPIAFFDWHEDYTDLAPYVFRFAGDWGNLMQQLALDFDMDVINFSAFSDDRGCSDYFLRKNGCVQCGTIELPPTWSLERRINKWKGIANWIVDHAYLHLPEGL